MDQLTMGILGCVAFVVLIFLRVPIAYAMGIVGTCGLLFVYGPATLLKFIPTQVYTHTANFTFSALPLFLLMGYLAFYADLSRDSYDAARAWFGKVPGGLAVATVYACAIFGACSGSSLAECAVFSKMSVPEMIKSGYNRKLALGVVASAGGLDVLIPPSIIMVVFGVMTETSIGQLLIAGIVPGDRLRCGICRGHHPVLLACPFLGAQDHRCRYVLDGKNGVGEESLDGGRPVRSGSRDRSTPDGRRRTNRPRSAFWGLFCSSSIGKNFPGIT